MRIAFLTRTLDRAGAQRQLVMLARGLKARGHDVAVIVLYPGGPFTEDLIDAGISVINLKRAGRWDLPRIVKAVNTEVSEFAPDVIHGYLETPNVLAAIAGAKVGKVVFGIRASRIDYSHYDWAIRFMNLVERRYSRFASAIIVNAAATEAFLKKSGYPAEKIHVIPNGIDTQVFARDLVKRTELRDSWGIPAGVPLAGLVARLDPKKNHRGFLEAAALVHRRRPDVHFVSVGIADKDSEGQLRHLTDKLGISGQVRFVAPQADMPGVYSALDVLCSTSSFGEGFPNVIAEAMSCRTPVVATDCGDSAMIVGDTGVVVPVGDVDGIANGVLDLLARDLETAGALARKRIETNFTPDKLIDRSERVLFGESVERLN